MISKELIKRTFDYYEKYKNHKSVVSPSLPILYFGDLSLYEKSEFKVITVAKNPSDNEFRLNKRDSFSFVRFSNWDVKKKNLIPTLNSYFVDKPLNQWFSSFKPLLNGLSTSYYKGEYKNTALHTDICSPLATNPTWSKLSKGTQSDLFIEGFEIWKNLIEELKPDLMLVSIPEALFKIPFKTLGNEFHTILNTKAGTPRKKPYIVKVHEYQLKNQKKVKVIFGPAANTPFGSITNESKKKIGKMCKEEFYLKNSKQI